MNCLRTIIDELSSLAFGETRHGMAIPVDKDPFPLPFLPPSRIAWKPSPRHSSDTGIFFGGVRVPKGVEAHYLFLGTTRSGKTTAIRLAMQDALSDLRDPATNSRALINDPKRDVRGIIEGMGLGEFAISLDPEDIRSFAWDVATDITTPALAQRLAEGAIPCHDDHFKQALQALFADIVVALIDLKDKTGYRWTLRTVFNILEDEKLLRAIAGRHHTGRKDVEAHLDGSIGSGFLSVSAGHI